MLTATATTHGKASARRYSGDASDEFTVAETSDLMTDCLLAKTLTTGADGGCLAMAPDEAPARGYSGNEGDEFTVGATDGFNDELPAGEGVGGC